MRAATVVLALALVLACAPYTGDQKPAPKGTQSQICIENRSGSHIAVYDVSRGGARVGTVTGICDCVILRGLNPSAPTTLGFKAVASSMVSAPPEELGRYPSWIVYLGTPPGRSPGTWRTDVFSLRPGTC